MNSEEINEENLVETTQEIEVEAKEKKVVELSKWDKVKKKKLEKLLEKFEPYIEPKVKFEQYPTPKKIVLDLYDFIKRDIRNINRKKAADFGAGTGRLTALLLILGFKKVYSIEIDKEAFAVLNYNIRNYMADYLDRWEPILGDVKDFNEEVQVVVSNPPFGIKRIGADREFVKKALELSKVAYFLHKIDALTFYERLAEEYGKKVEVLRIYTYNLRKMFPFHKKEVYRYKVALYKFYEK